MSAFHVRLYRQRLRKRAFDLIGRRCYFCGNRKNIHAAHVKPTGLNGAGRGMDRRYRDVIKHPNSYRPMCSHCHAKYDALVREKEPPIPF